MMAAAGIATRSVFTVCYLLPTELPAPPKQPQRASDRPGDQPASEPSDERRNSLTRSPEDRVHQSRSKRPSAYSAPHNTRPIVRKTTTSASISAADTRRQRAAPPE